MLLRRQQLLQGLQRRQPAGGILLAITAAEADPADDLVVDHNRKAADENGEPALEAPLDSERFVTGKRGPVRWLIEQMGRTLVTGCREGLVPRDLRTRHPGAVHPLQRQRIAAVIGDADCFQHADLPGFADRRGNHMTRLLEFQLE